MPSGQRRSSPCKLHEVYKSEGLVCREVNSVTRAEDARVPAITISVRNNGDYEGSFPGPVNPHSGNEQVDWSSQQTTDWLGTRSIAS